MKETKLGLSAKKASDFGEWYSQVVVESEMISYYDVSGAARQPMQPCQHCDPALLSTSSTAAGSTQALPLRGCSHRPPMPATQLAEATAWHC